MPDVTHESKEEPDRGPVTLTMQGGLTLLGPWSAPASGAGPNLQANLIGASGRLQRPCPRQPDPTLGLLWSVPPSSHYYPKMLSACCLPPVP